MSESLKNICHLYKIKYLLYKDPNSTFFQHKDETIRNKNQVNNFFKDHPTLIDEKRIPGMLPLAVQQH